MKKVKLIALVTILLTFIGCGGWTSEEKAVLMFHCPESNIDACECAASVIMDEFTFVEYVMLVTSFLNTSQLEEELFSRGQSIENKIEDVCSDSNQSLKTEAVIESIEDLEGDFRISDEIDRIVVCIC